LVPQCLVIENVLTRGADPGNHNRVRSARGIGRAGGSLCIRSPLRILRAPFKNSGWSLRGDLIGAPHPARWFAVLGIRRQPLLQSPASNCHRRPSPCCPISISSMLAPLLPLDSTGRRRAARIARCPLVTSSSMRVKALLPADAPVFGKSAFITSYTAAVTRSVVPIFAFLGWPSFRESRKPAMTPHLPRRQIPRLRVNARDVASWASALTSPFYVTICPANPHRPERIWLLVPTSNFIDPAGGPARKPSWAPHRVGHRP